MQCPECGEGMRGVVCACGYTRKGSSLSGDAKRQAAWEANGIPAVKAAVEAAIHMRMPAVGKGSTHATAAWLVDYLFEPPGDGDGVRTGHNGGYVTPYRDRVLYLTRKLAALSEMDQGIVLAHRENGVYWRGEPMWQLAHIAEEHAVQAGMTPEQRRERVAGRMRRFGVIKQLEAQA